MHVSKLKTKRPLPMAHNSCDLHGLANHLYVLPAFRWIRTHPVCAKQWLPWIDMGGNAGCIVFRAVF
jgi:hypothetical protein